MDINSYMMRNAFIPVSLFLCIIISSCNDDHKESSKFNFSGDRDPSLIRGFNYTPSYVKFPRHHIDSWVHYDSAAVEFDLDLAKRLNLNQARIFVPYQAYVEDKANLPAKLQHFVRECYKRGMGVMPVVGYGPWRFDTAGYPLARQWAQFLTDAIGNEPGLAMWDVLNEPDWPPEPKEWVEREFETGIFLAKTFHELDPNTPVTIGAAFVDGMIRTADYVDVLQFHDYSQTREAIRSNIQRAKAFAVKVNKPLIDGEIGCIARANPYDVTLQEHMDAGVGWYIWELMIVREGWGKVHGVFYEDGTVRDPSIAAAIMGFFRNRSENILPCLPDLEGLVTKMTDSCDIWLNDPLRTWEKGLDIAETCAYLLEAGELTPMRIPPSQKVYSLRRGKVDLPALKDLIINFKNQLEPYRLPPSKK
jgi:hypothetical protein